MSPNIDTITTEEQALTLITPLAAKFQIIMGRSMITRDDFAAILADFETGELSDDECRKCKEFFFTSEEEGKADAAAYAVLKRHMLANREEIFAQTP